MIKSYWESLGRGARIGLLAGIACIVAVAVGASSWLLRTDYQVLFTELKPQDTALMVTELDRMKVPYKIGADGNTILVEGDAVHSTRLKLMGKEMPLHGAAGFELFNNADFGMTEFAQKINYQRALQGEITRTILSLSEVREARVHLAMPEDGLFKKGTTRAKAAITLAMNAGQSLRPEQIGGIQRLVSAAVPGIAPQDVTIVDQQGVALTRPVSSEPDANVAGSTVLDLKRDTERLLAKKATEVLEGALGPGQAMATVDVTLNMDQVRVTTEDVLAAPGRMGSNAAGVIVKERETTKEAGPPLGRGDAAMRPANSQREVDYQVGRRVEQVATQPGAIRRLHVVAVVRQSLDAQQTEQMKSLIGASVGAVTERGDTVVVQSLLAFPQVDRKEEILEPAPQGDASSATASTKGQRADAMPTLAVGATALLVMIAAAAWWIAKRRAATKQPLTAQERERMLKQMRQWLDQAPEA